MKVSLISPPQVQNLVRGVGVYGKNLPAALEKIPGLEITANDPDLTHYLYFDPFFLTFPPVRKTKTVVTVFDLTPIVLKDLYPKGIRGEMKWQIQKRLLKTTGAIITISQSAKEDIARIINFPKNKIFVTYLAAGPQYKPLNLKRENFILYIGDINANKNISALLKAVSYLKDQKLVLVGKAFLEPNLPEAVKIRQEIKDLDLENQVKLAGYVSEKEKIGLLNKAKVYCQPSLYEGFGLPVLEAMSCGTQVVCGNNSSLPEVVGDRATFAEVTNPQDLADKLANFKKKDVLLQAGKFSWEKTAKETYEVYSKVLA